MNKTKLLEIAQALDLGSIDDKKARTLLLSLLSIDDHLQFSKREIDFAYLCGVFNTSGIDGLYTEIQRLKELGKEPHDIIESCRKRKVCPVCKKTFEKGWGEFCSQDCWDTDM